MIPTEISGMTSLEYLHIQNNTIEGLLPEEIGDLQSLSKFSCFNSTLSVSHNHISQLILIFISKGKIQIHQNHIFGPVPEEICSLRNVSLHEFTAGKE